MHFCSLPKGLRKKTTPRKQKCLTRCHGTHNSGFLREEIILNHDKHFFDWLVFDPFKRVSWPVAMVLLIGIMKIIMKDPYHVDDHPY